MHRTLYALMALVVVLAGCGDDGTGAPTTATSSVTTTSSPSTTTSASTTTTSAFPVTVGGVTVTAQPERIVSLSATHTEILYAIGAGDAVIATDLFSDHPAEALDVDKIDSFSLNIEAVAGLDPDLVILAFDPGDAVDGLAALDIPAILFQPPSELEGVFEQWVEVGRLTGHAPEAEALGVEAATVIGEIAGRVPQTLRAPTYFHELDSTLYTVTSSTIFGAVYGALGLANIADPADESGFGYPQLSAEYLLDADPDYVFLADTVCCDVTAESFGARPGFSELTAVQSGRVVELDDAVASRWGPRIVDFAQAIAAGAYPGIFSG